MDEYIKREALLEALENADPDVHEDYGDGTVDRGFGRENIQDMITGIPAADVAPVVHGRWMKRRNGGTLCSRCGSYTQYKGQVLDMSEAIACPWCGAKMDGGTDHEAD